MPELRRASASAFRGFAQTMFEIVGVEQKRSAVYEVEVVLVALLCADSLVFFLLP
jgi:hypothetical protein